jgi:pyruvate/2-oxoglutarate dehydrogenase complex dihydrolipoamide acyltransferase (E2) component
MVARLHALGVPLAFDHRIVDGADADRFMTEVKALLQDFPESAA